MNTCSWVIPDEERTCGDTGSVYCSFVVCEDHKEQFRNWNELMKRANALQASKIHELDSFPGYCYIMLLPNGNIKIGYSNTEKLLKTRITTLSREYGAPVVLLKTIKGGFVAEAMLHDRFKHLRLPGVGEQFKYGPGLAEFISNDME